MYSRRSVHRMRGTTAISQSMDTAGSTSPSLGWRFCHMVCGCVGVWVVWFAGSMVRACVCVCAEEGGWLNSLCPSHARLFDRGGRASVAREHGRQEVILCVCLLCIRRSAVSPRAFSTCQAVQRNAKRKMTSISLPLSMNLRLERRRKRHYVICVLQRRSHTENFTGASGFSPCCSRRWHHRWAFVWRVNTLFCSKPRLGLARARRPCN